MIRMEDSRYDIGGGERFLSLCDLTDQKESNGRKLRYCHPFAAAILRHTYYCHWHKRVRQPNACENGSNFYAKGGF